MMTCVRNEAAMDNLWILFAAAGAMVTIIGGLALLGDHYTLNNIKSKTVGDGQHGTARWATDAELRKTYALVPFQVSNWRAGKKLPETQGLVLGSTSGKHGITALVDKDDVHCLMIGASGVGKTAYFLYPNLEYACASGMSFLALDTKGDLARNYGAVAARYYGYHVSVVDLRNPTRSDGYNLMTLINHYMDETRTTGDLAARAKAEKYAKILAKTVVSPNGDTDYGQNAYFYDAAEGLLTSVVLLLAEFLPPDSKCPTERRHIVSVFKLVQELLAPSGVRGKNWFTLLMDRLPDVHKARWFAGAALDASEQAMASVMSTVLSRLNAFLDSELEQVLCFDSATNAEQFAAEKSAIFLILPEEDTTKNFMAGLMIQTLARELFAVADENGGHLPSRVVFYCDEFGTIQNILINIAYTGVLRSGESISEIFPDLQIITPEQFQRVQKGREQRSADYLAKCAAAYGTETISLKDGSEAEVSRPFRSYCRYWLPSPASPRPAPSDCRHRSSPPRPGAWSRWRTAASSDSCSARRTPSGCPSPAACSWRSGRSDRRADRTGSSAARR